MTTALVFAGGAGKRMNSRSRPKQFLEMYGKPIIIYTLEHFEYHEKIDDIVVVCIKGWIEELEVFLKRFGISKVKTIVPGGATGHDSICCGLQAMRSFCKDDDIVLIHDGVRPFVTEKLITENIMAVEAFGSAITSEEARESIVRSIDGEQICDVPPRSQMYTAKAPQSFRFGKILRLYEKADANGIKSIDPSHLCSIYHEPMHLILSTKNNIKITEPTDFYVFRALYEALESQQIYGF